MYSIVAQQVAMAAPVDAAGEKQKAELPDLVPAKVGVA